MDDINSSIAIAWATLFSFSCSLPKNLARSLASTNCCSLNLALAFAFAPGLHKHGKKPEQNYIGWTLDGVHNSRRRAAPSRLAASHRSDTAPHGCLVATFCTFWPCDSDLWPFDLILIGGWGIVMDYHCAKFDNFSFSRFGFYRADRQTESQTHRRRWSLYSRDYRRRE